MPSKSFLWDLFYMELVNECINTGTGGSCLGPSKLVGGTSGFKHLWKRPGTLNLGTAPVASAWNSPTRTLQYQPVWIRTVDN